MDEQQLVVINEDEMIDYIFQALLSEGIVVNRKDISTILNLEMAYLDSVGLAEPVNDGDTEGL